ncbi:MAG: hypothetical protein JNM71_04890 [Flavobacterium lindanitolerans]|uniref:hypothetical protein n=1 Tax=Flavobacterium lindanitolerans TaxID=428988 RepID=UPI001A5B6BCF|nr:hypothetical protein [Flavobacterium lindanitolerans]MBL7867334.1 hypothetical protein [Flavobacterium lindanitolerans]
MEAWSDTPIVENFKIKFFLDTNILSFLIDGSHQGLTDAISMFNKLGFVDLLSSNYVIFEFCGIRKKEHYLRLALSNLTTPAGYINVSTLLKYNGYSVPGVDFFALQPQIKAAVEQELIRITNDFNINYSANLLHNDLIHPTFDICLSSKISREDSLVLTSSILPESKKPDENINLLSKDEQFSQAFTEFDINNILKGHSLPIPKVISISNIALSSGSFVNLTSDQDVVRLNSFLPSKLFEMICDKNADLLLGRIFMPNGVGFPQDIICFKLQLNKELPVDPFITIISKDLNFIYTSKVRITDFRQNGTLITLPFTTADDTKNNISFKMLGENGSFLPQNMINSLKEEGNMLFIHPDS